MQVGVDELAAAEVLEEGRQADEDGLGEEGLLVVAEEVVQGRYHEAGGLFLGGEAEELAVE